MPSGAALPPARPHARALLGDPDQDDPEAALPLGGLEIRTRHLLLRLATLKAHDRDPVVSGETLVGKPRSSEKRTSGPSLINLGTYACRNPSASCTRSGNASSSCPAWSRDTVFTAVPPFDLGWIAHHAPKRSGRAGGTADLRSSTSYGTTSWIAVMPETRARPQQRGSMPVEPLRRALTRPTRSQRRRP
jgi:hypothetical protein